MGLYLSVLRIIYLAHIIIGISRIDFVDLKLNCRTCLHREGKHEEGQHGRDAAMDCATNNLAAGLRGRHRGWHLRQLSLRRREQSIIKPCLALPRLDKHEK